MFPSKTNVPTALSPRSNFAVPLSNVTLFLSKVIISIGTFVSVSVAKEPLPISSPNGYLARLTRPVEKLKDTG